MYPPFGWGKVTSWWPLLIPISDDGPWSKHPSGLLLFLPRSTFIYPSSVISPSLRRPEIRVCRQDRERVGRGPTNSDQLALAGVAVCLNVSGMFGPQVSRVPASNFFPPPLLYRWMAEQDIDVGLLLLHRINCSRI